MKFYPIANKGKKGFELRARGRLVVHADSTNGKVVCRFIVVSYLFRLAH
jgi:hypothetical protein